MLCCLYILSQLGCGIDANFYTSEDDLIQELVDFDQEYGSPKNIRHQLSDKVDVKIHTCTSNESLFDQNPCDVLILPTDRYYFKGMNLQDAKKIRIKSQKYSKSDCRPIILHQNIIIDR